MTRAEKLARIEQLWATESGIIFETSRVVAEAEQLARGALEPIRKERDALEREVFDGSTRVEVMSATGKDPITGKSLEEIRTEALQNILTKMGGGEECDCPDCQARRQN